MGWGCIQEWGSVQADAVDLRLKLWNLTLGPGDEGQYSCTVSNDYGSVTATLNVNPEVNALRHGGLSHGSSGALRASLQRKMKHQNSDLNSDCNHD